MRKHTKGIDWSAGEVVGGQKTGLDLFVSSRPWNVTTTIALVSGVLGLAIPLLVLFRGLFGGMDTRAEGAILVALLLAFVFFRFRSTSRPWTDPPDRLFPLDLLLALLAIATGVYTLWGVAIQDTVAITLPFFGQEIRADHIVGIIVIGLVLEATRRSFGWIMVALALFFIVHSLTASYWPGPFAGARATWRHTVEYLYVIEEGVYGIGTQVFLSMMFPFLIFGSLLINTKSGAFFMSLANSLVGRFSGGAAKVSVVGSGLLATLTGSGVANVATVGSITIPMMKKAGYKPSYAAGVETCASVGSYFTPPIMGAAAFLIAAFTNTPYLTVALYAAIPAFLFYLGVFVQAHFRAKKEGLKGLPESEIPSLRRVMVEGGYLLIPLVVIVAGLVLGYSVTRVAIWGIFCIILLSFVRKETRQTPRRLLANFERAIIMAAGIGMCVVAVGVIQGAVMASGLGMRLSLVVQNVAMGNLVIGLLVAGVIQMILGLGLNPLLVYLISYIFVIPALVKAGAPVLPVHLSALIFATIADITPPVAVSAFVASSIAKCGPMEAGLSAMKLGFAAYLLPFLIVLHPTLLGLGVGLLEGGLALITTAAGIFFLAAALEGWLLKKASILQRILLAAGGIGLLTPDLTLGAIGSALIVSVALWQKVAPRYARWA